MNKADAKKARADLKKGLALLPESSRDMFKRMYWQSTNEVADFVVTIDDIIDAMPNHKLDTACRQVSNTLPD